MSCLSDNTMVKGNLKPLINMQIDFRFWRVFWTKAYQVNNRCRENGLNYEWPKWLLTLKYWECNFHFIPNNVQNAAY
jgi:hypothetical protein